MHLRTLLVALSLLVVATACQTTPLDNIWPGCTVCAPPQPEYCPPPPVQQAVVQQEARIPYEVRIDERVSPIVDCNPVRTQHTLVATVYDQYGQPLPGQRVDWILSRFGDAVGDIVASDDQYGQGAITPMSNVYVGNNGNKIDNTYVICSTNHGPEMIDSGNNYPYEGANGARLPDITINEGQTWVTITSTRGGITDVVCYVPGIRDGVKHKVFATKVWADFDVEFPEDAVNTLPNASHNFPVRVHTRVDDPLEGQLVEAEILDGPDAVFEGSGGTVAEMRTGPDGMANFKLTNRAGEPGANRVRFTVKGRFYDEVCPRSRIVTKTWKRVDLAVNCAFTGGPGIVGKTIEKVITISNTGDADAEGVVLEDMPSGGLRISDGQTFPMNIGTLAAGETRDVRVRFTSDAEGTFENKVVLRDGGAATAQSSCSIEFVKGALEITKVCEPAKANIGSQVQFIVTVTNSGRGPLENVVVVDEYPAGIKPTSKNSATLAIIPAGESREIIFTGTASEVGTHNNSVRATADGIPEKQAACSLQVTTCNLEMAIVGPERIYFGEEANFTLKVTNVGDGNANGCAVRVKYGGCLGGGFEDFNIGPLAPGEEWVTDFSKTATSVGPCTVDAESNCGQKCSTKSNAELRVTGLTALQVEMIDKALDGAEKGIFRTGETFIYSMRVENDVGTEATPPLLITWDLPPELEFVTGRCLNGQVAVTGSGQQASSAEFTMGVGGYLDFEIQVRVRDVPASSLITTQAKVLRASDKAALASETESTTLKD